MWEFGVLTRPIRLRVVIGSRMEEKINRGGSSHGWVSVDIRSVEHRVFAIHHGRFMIRENPFSIKTGIRDGLTGACN